MASAVDSTVQVNRQGWTGIAEKSQQQQDRISSTYCSYNVFSSWKSQSRHKQPTVRSPSNTPAVKPCGSFPPCTARHLHIDLFKTNVKIPLFQWGQLRTINKSMSSSTSHGINECGFPTDIFQMIPSAASLSGFWLLGEQAAQAGATLRQLHLSDWQAGCYLLEQGWEILWWGHQYGLCPQCNFQGI